MTAKDKKGRPVELPDFISSRRNSISVLGTFYIVVHTKTRVKYICLNRSGSENTLTPMLNSDGTLLLATHDEIIELLREDGIYVE
jgi:hypothetical protein